MPLQGWGVVVVVVIIVILSARKEDQRRPGCSARCRRPSDGVNCAAHVQRHVRVSAPRRRGSVEVSGLK